jgi:hypothetical protein
MKILNELERYNKNVRKHYDEFEQVKIIWAKVMHHFKK